MSTTSCFTWNDAGFTYNGNEYTWNEACLVIEVAEHGGLPGFNKLDEKKKEEFITLLLKIKGEKDIKQTKKKIRNIKVTSNDIDIVINEVLKGIKVNL